MDAPQIISISEEIVDFLMSQPTPEEILAFKVSDALQARLRYLLNKNKESCLTDAENKELDEMEFADHLIMIYKARIQLKMMKDS